MAIRDNNRVADGFLTLDGGIDSGILPSVVRNNQGAWAINSQFQGGYWTHRPGFVRRLLTYPDDKPEDPQRQRFEEGYFQGGGVYASDDGVSYFVSSISGRIFRTNLSDFTTVELKWDDVNSPALKRAWFCQAENYLIIQNAQDPPLIYDGATLRQSKGINKKEVPTGGPMAYGRGRLWVARKHEYLGGDLVYSDGTRGAILNFTENDFLSEGGAFAVPSQAGKSSTITALHFPSNLDTAFGEGDLFVFTTNDIFIFQAPLQREVWKALEYPIQRFGLKYYGTFSDNSVVEANADLYFRAEDGVRSFVFARRDFQSRWGNTPISGEVSRALDGTNPWLLYASSSVIWENFAIHTALPRTHNRGVIHRGLMVMDTDPVNSMQNKLPPIWNGVWVGPPILQVFKARVNDVERCFIIGLYENGKIGMWEISKGANTDENDTPIQWALETRSMAFNSPLDLKRLSTADVWVDQLSGKVRFSTAYRSDLNPCWRPWHCWEEEAAYQDCGDGTDACKTPHTYNAQTRCRMSLPEPTNEADDPNKKMHRDGYEFQVRIFVTGHTRFVKFRAVAERLSEQLSGVISDPCPD